jgi:hypothetical protein
MTDRYFHNDMPKGTVDEPQVVREILKAAAVALKVSCCGCLLSAGDRRCQWCKAL